MNPSVSAIIPVYNVVQYLPECLDSVIGQTLEDIEIICVVTIIAYKDKTELV